MLTEFSEASTLEDDVNRLSELALRVKRLASTLDEDDERLREDAWSEEIELFLVLRAASTLLELEDSERLDALVADSVALAWLSTLSTDEELLESWFELVPYPARVASTLDDEFKRLRLEV